MVKPPKQTADWKQPVVVSLHSDPLHKTHDELTPLLTRHQRTKIFEAGGTVPASHWVFLPVPLEFPAGNLTSPINHAQIKAGTLCLDPDVFITAIFSQLNSETLGS